MRAIFFFVFLVIFCTAASGQRTCLSAQYNELSTAGNPGLASAQQAIENFIQQRSLPSNAHLPGGAASAAPLIVIPVVVHVLYNKEDQNISDEEVKSGIEALNRDFQRTNPDSVNTPDAFKSLAADCGIQFVLATADPAGRATTGITRKWTAATEWKMDDKIKSAGQGGVDAWDTRSYLNIWIGPMRNLLGYASSPGAAADKDGVVIATNAFGLTASRAPYNLGRTAVHEVGHWLGLKHIWGDTYCGDDGVHDTPRQGNFTSGCPKGIRSSCSNGPAGDMYMNYMDFTDDACMNLFTEGQKERMRALFLWGGPRAGILSSKGLEKPWTQTIVPEVVTRPVVTVTGMTVYPNPATHEVTADFRSDESWIGKELSIYNAQGLLLRKERIVSPLQKISLYSLKPGVYFLKGTNGAAMVNFKFLKA